MTITHIVQFAFQSSASEEDVKKIIDQLLSLKDTCIHPTSKQPYIQTMAGGKNNSPEGANKGLTHAAVMTFANTQDRDYYLRTDPAHLAFIAGVKPIMADVCVLDFETGVY